MKIKELIIKLKWRLDDGSPPIFTYWKFLPFADYFLAKNIRIFLFSFICFIIYYILPNLCSTFFGCGLPKQFSIKSFFTIAPNKMLYAFTDCVHLAFAISMPFLGLFFGGIFIKYSANVIKLTASRSCLIINKEDYNKLITIFIHRISNPLIYVLPILFGLLAFFTFQYMHNNVQLVNWWGNKMYGEAGTILSINISLVIIAAVWGAELLILLLSLIISFLKSPVHIKLFSYDNCNGLFPLGKLLILIYVLLFLAGLGFSSVYLGSYFGLERSSLFIIAFSFYFVVVLVLVFFPIFIIASKIYSEKEKLLMKLEDTFNNKIEKSLYETIEIPDIANYSQVYSKVESINIFPFSNKSMLIMSITYFGQIAGFVFSLASKV